MPDANSTTETSGGDPKGESQGSAFENFEAFLAEQPEDVKTLYENHAAGLKNSVKAARDERDALSKQVKDLLKKADKGSELEKQLLDFNSKLESAEKRAAFAEDAIRPEIGCTNVKAAFLIAQADDLFRRDGAPDWEEIRRAAPELFRKPGSANGTAGNGTGDDASKLKASMNDAIRKAAGR